MNKIDYRYTIKGEFEKQANVHIREMIEMIKNEEVKDSLYVKAVKLSKHAFERMQEHFSVSSMGKATKIAKDMLKNAIRIGTILAYDGRINVLYAYCQTAFFMSPDLKTLVTVSKCPIVTYRQLQSKINEGIDKESLIKFHLELLEDMEKREQEQIRLILKIEQKVKDSVSQCAWMLDLIKSGERKRDIKRLITDLNKELKNEGRKLFDLKVQKRHICKSLVALH